jgi:choline kinase
MKAVMLAAGIGNRLSKEKPEPPKVLLRFAGRSLLERHVAMLKRFGIGELVIGVGYEARMIEQELARIGAGGFARTVHNPHFREGSGVTLAALAADFAAGGDVMLMDGDVLYEEEVLARLVRSRHRNCFLMDRDFEPGDEPVKLCQSGGRLVDFHKKVEGKFDLMGESVGFFRFDGAVAREIDAHCRRHIRQGERALWYEESIRDVLVASPAGRFGYEDVTGLAWIEIDFPDDVRRAAEEILPKVDGVKA